MTDYELLMVVFTVLGLVIITIKGVATLATIPDR